MTHKAPSGTPGIDVNDRYPPIAPPAITDRTGIAGVNQDLMDRHRRRWMTTMILLAIVVRVNVLSNDYCDDGIPIVAENSLITEPGSWLKIWTQDYWHAAREAAPQRDLLYRPVALLTYRAVYQWISPEPWAQLAVNLILHALAAVLVFKVALLLLLPISAAGIAGVLFSVLPIHTEVIANVVGRGDILVTVGTLAAVLASKYVLTARDLAARAFWIFVTAGWVFVSFSAKESGVAALVIVPVLQFFLWRRNRTGTSSSTLRSGIEGELAKSSAPQAGLPGLNLKHRGVGSGLAVVRAGEARAIVATWVVLVIVAGVYGLLRWIALEQNLWQKPALTKTVNLLVDAPGWQRVLGVIQLWGMYWAKTIFPLTLNVNYSLNAVRLATTPFDVHVVVGMVVLITLWFACRRAWRGRDPGPAFLFLTLVVSYVPGSNALTLIQVFFAERIWYGPSAWAVMLIGLGGASRLSSRSRVFVLVGLVAAFAGRNILRNQEWRNNLTLYASSYRDHPEGVGSLRLLGQTLVGAGRLEEGLALLERAVQMDPGFTDAQRSLGHAYGFAGDLGRAVHHLQIADMQVPDHPPTVQALTFARDQLRNQFAGELETLRVEVEAHPDNVEAVLILVHRLRGLGFLDDALRLLDSTEQRFADDASWNHERAVSLVYGNQRDEAILAYDRCLSLDPEDTQTMVELAMLLLERRERNDLDRARVLSNHALNLAPQSYQAILCRAELLALDGRLSEAVALYREVIQRLPVGSSERRTMEDRARALGG